MSARRFPSRSAAARLAAALGLALVALVAASCGEGGTEDNEAGEELTVRDAWARSTAGNPGENTAIYLVIENEGDADRLIGAAATEVASTIELHETREQGGQMRMQPVESWPVPSDGELVLEPGARHLMVLGVTDRLEAGDTFEVTLTFEQAGALNATVEVRDAPPTSSRMPAH